MLVVLVYGALCAQAVVRNTRTGTLYPTITQAVNAALDGDTLNLATGLYAETVWITNKALTLAGGYDTGGVTRIANTRSYIGSSASGGVRVRYVAPVVFDRIAISGVVSGIALDVRDGASVSCRYCRIQHNRGALLTDGGGLVVRYSSHASLFDTRLEFNSAPRRGGGAYVTDNSALTLEDLFSVVANNTAALGGGVAVEAGSRFGMYNALLYGNVSSNHGGAIYASNSAVIAAGPNAAIGEQPLERNRAVNGSGGGVYAMDATLIVSNGAYIVGNISSNHGGGIYAGRSHVQLSSGALLGAPTTNWGNCSVAGCGGGLYLRRGTAALHDARVRANSAGNRLAGAGLFVQDGSQCIISNSTVHDNAAVRGDSFGGGIMIWSGAGELPSTWALSGSVVSNNTCGTAGGGLLLRDHAGLISTSRVVGNRAAYGGGLQTEGGTLRIESSEFSHNIAREIGGAMRCWGGTTEFASSAAMLNSATNGGAIEVTRQGTLVRVTDDRGPAATFSGNTATNGGAWYVDNYSHLLVAGSTDANANRAHEAGGAAFVHRRARLTVVCTNDARLLCMGNTAGTHGGALAVYGSSVLDAQGLVCENNACTNDGGALYVNNATAQVYCSTAEPLRSTPVNHLAGNCARRGGAVMADNHACLALANALVLTNRAQFGGGVYLYDNSRCDAWNVLIISNHATVNGGAVLASHTSTLSAAHCTLAANMGNGVVGFSSSRFAVTNCILWNHNPLAMSLGATAEVCYAVVYGGYAGTGNLNTDPRFVNPAACDYQLAFDSPCIDTGVFAGIMYDCIGTPRPYGSAPDLGAYEFVPEPGAAGVLGLVTFYSLQFTMWRRRGRK